MANPDPLITEWVPVWNLSAPTIVTAHAPTHETGGSDPINDLDGSVINSGTIADARLSGNVALRNTPNNFSVPQVITNAGVAEFRLIDTSQPADARLFRVLNNSQLFYIQAANDAVAVQQGAVTMDRVGNLKATGTISELNRTVAMGHWQDVPFNAANFSSVGAGSSWTVGSAAILRNRYTLIGKTMHWSMYISWFSGSNVVAGTTAELRVVIPGGFTTPGLSILAGDFCVDGSGTRSDFDISPTSSVLSIAKRVGGNFIVGAVGFVTTLTFEVA